jgi:hypothetical protein
LITLRNLIAEIGILLDQPSQLGLDKVEEGVYLVFVVAALADRRLTERHVANVGGPQRHRITSRLGVRLVCQPLNPSDRYGLGSITTRIRMNTTRNKKR